MTDEIKQPEQSEVLPPEGEKSEESPFTFLEYLDSDRGHEIAKTVLGLWKELQQATLGSKSDETKEQLRRQHEAWRLSITMQTALGAVVIITAGVLAWHSKMDATIAGFLGVALGYVLGRKTG
jgi:ferric-dicitrate binding protein FerR (iron transport regulator)